MKDIIESSLLDELNLTMHDDPVFRFASYTNRVVSLDDTGVVDIRTFSVTYNHHLVSDYDLDEVFQCLVDELVRIKTGLIK